ncbi:hypothetical protein CBS101457_003729 [Exobasidium rhododendri]|nr:hypothetical protein CBS101457_003729 [Exobasidium rhododendri]
MAQRGGKTFGLTSSSGRGRGAFKRRGGSSGQAGSHSDFDKRNKNQDQQKASSSLVKGAFDDATSAEDRFREAAAQDEIDSKMGFERLDQGESKEAWLVNMHPTITVDAPLDGPIHASGKSAVDYYFIQDDASMFKVTIPYQPYFLVGCRIGTEGIVEDWLRRKYEGLIATTSREAKEDLKLPNHLVGLHREFIKLNFHNIQDLMSVRKELLPLATKAQKNKDAVDTYAAALEENEESSYSAAMSIEMEVDTEGWVRSKKGKGQAKVGQTRMDPEECINDLREYDVPYYLRVAIDNDIRVGLWYNVSFDSGHISLTSVPSRVKRAEPTVLAYDIETTKLPLKFPDAETDSIMMISYMIDGQGFLITNREIVSEDIDDFEYSPKEEYEGPFIIFNEVNEEALLRRFFSHFREARPTIVATYNGDSFDFPFVEARATFHGLSMLDEIGFQKDNEGEYKSRTTAHMDCFRWVKRDSYLPQGSQGLKAVTVAKLGYDPMELDPELMTPYAMEQPQILAQYSVSDAVATYYLYMKYVHPFIFSLCNIIPLNPDEVLRKGSGTLCETLLMVQAYKGNIIMPNRHTDPIGNTYKGHLLESETYVGGHVEALEAGVFRSDIPTHFKVDPTALEELIRDLDKALQFSITEESKMAMDDITNYDEVKAQVQVMLEKLRDEPNLQIEPLIYHLDVAAMYPNIMLSNRLQPDAVVEEAACATCDYNRPGMTCNKKMQWSWRGEYFPAKRDEVNMIRNALSNEQFPPKYAEGTKRSFHELGNAEQTVMLHKRVGDYSRKVYRKTHETKIVTRETIVCQRENPFYIDTVRDFRDRRYEYKGLHKTWKKNLDAANTGVSNGTAGLAEVMEAKKMIVLYDSLQMAHKCILNSFYGYVMRKGARWYSMEMAGITCLTGATIIQLAKDLVDRIGRPLELDTDGIWCMLPGNFPENFQFKTKNGKGLSISYPCTMLNHLVHQRFTNHQYHQLVDKSTGRYEVHSENSIFFELDGPYRAMILPSSKEEDKLLKKRYAVFEHDGTLAELKGFEVKRRGELQLIKDFQKQIFEKFLLGTTLVECYAAVAKVADQWLDVLFSKGSTLHDEELIDLIAENKSMSKTLVEYGKQKSTAITTAKRLAEFLGAQMVKNKGLACKFIISEKPHGAPVTERAVPVAIFNAEPSIKQYYLRKFLRDDSLHDFDLRNILDWKYYIERFGGVIQKLITIPAAMQRVTNPVPRIRHPDWLFKRVAASDDKFQQRKLTDMFKGSVGEKRIIQPFSSKVSSIKRRALEYEVIEVDDVLPDMHQDYPGWLRVMKKRWRKARMKRARGDLPAAATALPQSSSTTNLFAKKARDMATAVWDIVQISPTSRLGEFRLWISIDSRLHVLKIRIPRTFYINFKSLPAEGTFSDIYKAESVVRSLPRGVTCRHLFKITVDEDIYTAAQLHFSTLMNHPNVEGVYELQVPLDVRALIKLGSCCSIDAKARSRFSRGLDFGFEMDDLVKAQHPSIEKHRYLSGGAGLQHVYLWHGGKDSRHVMGIFSPNGKLTIHVVDSAGIRQLPALEPMYKERMAKWMELGGRKSGNINQDGSGAFHYREEIEIELKLHTTRQRAWKVIAKELLQIKRESVLSTMLTVTSNQDQGYYEAALGSYTMNEFPLLLFNAGPLDNNFPTLGWQVYAVKRMMGVYLRQGFLVQEYLKMSSQFDIPIGNFRPGNFSIFASDIDFARRLAKSDMLLWWSERTEGPDLGGLQLDGNFVDSSNSSIATSPSTLEISKPGSYNNVVFEITIGDLAMNALLQSAGINEMEGSKASGSMAFDNTSHNLDEYANGTVPDSASIGASVVTSQVFWTMKNMVKSWYVEKIRNKNLGISNALADGFWKWMNSEKSSLFEPAIVGFMNELMKKTLLQLLGECKRLGASIIYASFGRLFLLTSKPTAGSAAAYGRYLISALTSRDLFKHLDMKIDHHWEYLLWMDPANFGGVICQNPEEVFENEAQYRGKEFVVDMQWNISTFLPMPIRKRFSQIVATFIRKLYESKRKLMSSRLADRTPLMLLSADGNNTGNGAGAGEGEDEQKTVDSEDTKAAKLLLSQWVTRKMLHYVDEIQRLSAHGTVWEWPLLPGRDNQHVGSDNVKDDTSVALEFVKTTMAVFSLHREASVEVGVCRRNVLDILGVSEFSAIAEFKNPCESLILQGVVCQFCNEDRNFDFCRDPDLLHPVASTATIGHRHQQGGGVVWKCTKCQCPYDKMDIEMKLCAMATECISTFCLQDLRCQKCDRLKEGNVGLYCSCSGTWGLTVTRKDSRKRLENMRRVARYHKLSILEEAVEELLEQC